LPNFCRTVKLSVAQQVELSLALAQAEPAIAAVGLRHLRLKLPDLEYENLPAETLLAVSHVLKGEADAIVLPLLRRDAASSACVAPVLEPSMNHRPTKPVAQAIPNDAANLVRELGYAATSRGDVLRAILAEAGALPLSPFTAARLALMFANTMTGLDDELSPVLVNALLPESVAPVPDEWTAASWNVDVVAGVLRGVDAAAIAQALDQPDICCSDPAALKFLLLLLARSAERVAGPIIADALLAGPWMHPAAQLALLEAAITDPTALDLSKGGPLPALEDTAEMIPPGPSVGFFSNPNLVCVLVGLGEGALGPRARALLDIGAKACPEALLLSLGAVSHLMASHRLHGALLNELLPPLFSPSPRPAVLLVGRLAGQCGTLVRAAARQSFTAKPTPATLAHISLLARSVGPALVTDAGQGELAVAWACAVADRNEVDLDAWAGNSFAGPAAAVACESALSFLAKQMASAAPRGSPSVALLSIENVAALLKALDRSALTPRNRLAQLSARALSVHPNLSSLMAPAPQEQRQRMKEMEGEVSDGPSPGPPPSTSSDDIEECANSYFQRIYTSEQSISEVIEMLKRFKSSPSQREQEIFACMIHNLFDEYRFFHKYPEKELRITGILFGALVQHQLVSSITLGIALRYVLEALRNRTQNGKMFRFGMFALEQFKGRLSEWPQYCSHIVAIDQLAEHHRDLIEDIRRAMTASRGSSAESGMGIEAEPKQPEPPLPAPAAPVVVPTIVVPTPVTPVVPPVAPAAVAPTAVPTPTPPASSNAAAPLAAAAEARSQASQETPADRGLIMTDIMPAGAEPGLALNQPPEMVIERIHLVFNNVSMQNLDAKAAETRGVLDAEFLPWFGNYLVVKRISSQPNFHQLYMAFLLKLDAPELMNSVLASVFRNVSKLLASPKITTSTTERSLLKNLGSFLGHMTLARNKPVLQRKLDVKEVLCQGFETGRLIAVTPFVAKIMEGAKDSRVFRPPNPWIMGLMGVLRELYDLEDLKMNIKFEVKIRSPKIFVHKFLSTSLTPPLTPCFTISSLFPSSQIEVLSKHLGLKIDEVPAQRVLCHRLQPRKDKAADFNVRPSAVVQAVEPTPEPEPAPTPPPQPSVVAPAEPVAEQTVIPNLAAYVTVNGSLALLAAHPQLKAIVALAVDRAIREVIQPVVERSSTIACITTKELVAKDFALEASEAKMRKAAQLMVANLAGSLAVVTSRDPLRLSMINHLRLLLQQSPMDPAALEAAVQACSNDNLDLGCMLVERAATEAAVRDVDEALAAPLAERRKASQQGQAFADDAQGRRFPAALPRASSPHARWTRTGAAQRVRGLRAAATPARALGTATRDGCGAGARLVWPPGGAAGCRRVGPRQGCRAAAVPRHAGPRQRGRHPVAPGGGGDGQSGGRRARGRGLPVRATAVFQEDERGRRPPQARSLRGAAGRPQGRVQEDPPRASHVDGRAPFERRGRVQAAACHARAAGARQALAAPGSGRVCRLQDGGWRVGALGGPGHALGEAVHPRAAGAVGRLRRHLRRAGQGRSARSGAQDQQVRGGAQSSSRRRAGTSLIVL
jgi:CCR4-NOT transcription complex subunit 1